MKKITLLLLLVLSQSIFAQTKLTETQKLAATCKVWGYLKYYHPKVADGSKNWDNQLFDVLGKVEQANTKEEFSLVLENWIDSLGEVNEIAPIILPKEIDFFDKNFDLSWINNNKLFSATLSKKLKFIENNRFQGEQNYVGQHKAENIFIKNENYSGFQFNNKKTTILALFTYWNLIEYFFPYKYLMDQKWDTTLDEMLPVFIEVKNEDAFFTVMQKLTVKLNDTHGVFYNNTKTHRYFLPVNCKIIDYKIIVTEILADSLAKADDIKIGDVITKVNDKTIKEIIIENRDLINGSNEAAYLENLLLPTLTGFTENIKLEFFKDGKYITKIINRYDYDVSHSNKHKKTIKKEKFKILENNIGYVDMGTLTVKDVPDMIESLKLAKAIVFDMRNYPQGTYLHISNFLNSKEKDFAIFTIPVLNYPGRFKWSRLYMCGSENINNYKGKVVVLLNEKSVSHSEFSAMCFQTADNTTIVGSQTAGADGNISLFDPIKDLLTAFSGLGVYYPDRRETQRIGIIPDIEVKPTTLGIQQGKDEVLDRALQFIEIGK
ncbi:S41 family peptidase [Flavobacterium sp. A45]|uniref:S41 family peptidase n=1 Tax=Flavobacterium sp. A45 TaxID=1945862 RepID=UPI0009870A97|nr:S41 family peptidase [Flavobacterium sp. A45]OOG73286.1 peptidase S41 [Flavobacterium sp. A45]